MAVTTAPTSTTASSTRNPAAVAEVPRATTTQTIHTPSSTQSFHSPDQTRNNHVPSVVSSGRMSFSQDAFASSSILSIVPANVDSATAQWLGLLISDASEYTNGTLSSPDCDDEFGGLDVLGNSENNRIPTRAGHRTTDSLPSLRTHPNSSHPTLQERMGRPADDKQLLEVQAWYSMSPIELMPREHFLLRNFIRNISCTMDLFDPRKSFGTFVPHLAIHNAGLFNAIMALSIRHLALKAKEADASPEKETNRPHPNEAIRYYYKTLHYIQRAMEYDTYKTSLELLATSIIVSTYEMLDGSRRDWERHLKGVFGIQRSQVIHGDSGGLRQAVWWSWLCQDVWAAFRERRKPRTFWQPKRTLDELDPYELAARSVLLFAHVVAFCSEEAIEEHQASPAARIAKADALLANLEDWRRHHTVEFDPLPAAQMPGDVFQPLWIHPPAFGVAMQIYYCALILLALNRPHVGDLDTYLQQRKQIQQYVAMVCGIAMTLTEDAASIMCSQCLFIAGLPMEDPQRQNAILDMLEQCRQRALWPATPLGEELTRKWQEAS